MRPKETESAAFFAGYVSLVPELDLLAVLEAQLAAIPLVWKAFPESAEASEERPAPLGDIIESFESLRRANMLLIRNFPDAAWSRVGTTSGSRITARALAYVIAGHVRHHDAILRQRLARAAQLSS